MQILLLSGGSGKRLWPLSNNSRSKQFIKLLNSPAPPDDETKRCNAIDKAEAISPAIGPKQNEAIKSTAKEKSSLK